MYGGGAGYGAPPMINHIPRIYLGTSIHPSENPLLPAQEQIRDSQPVDGYDATNDVAIIKKACKGFGVSLRDATSQRPRELTCDRTIRMLAD